MSLPLTRTKKEKIKKAEDPSLYPFQLEQGNGENPGEIYGHTTVIHEDAMYVFGGCNQKGVFNGELFKYNFAKRRWKRVPTEGTSKPKGRHFHAAVVYHNKMYLFGGKSNGYMNDLYSLDFDTLTWSQEDNVSGKPPSKRYGHSAVVYNKCMYIYGGYDDFGYKSNEMYEYRMDSHEWRRVECEGDVVPERFHHTAVVHQGSMYIFGGLAGDSFASLLFEYRFSTRRWARVHTIGKSPEPRWGHAALVYMNKMYIFGGCDNLLNFKEVHKFNFESSRWSKAKHEGFEPRHFCSHTEHQGRFYIFAGRNIHNYCFNDITVYSPDVWRSKRPDTYVVDMAHMLNDKEFSDIVFCFPEDEDRVVYAHKSVLASRCPSFKVMLRSGMKECVEGKINICDVKYHMYYAFLEYLYTGQLPQPHAADEVLELLQLGDRYMLEHLKSLCERKLAKLLTLKNLSTFYEAALHFKGPELQERCVKYGLKFYDSLDKKTINKSLFLELKAARQN